MKRSVCYFTSNKSKIVGYIYNLWLGEIGVLTFIVKIPEIIKELALSKGLR